MSLTGTRNTKRRKRVRGLIIFFIFRNNPGKEHFSNFKVLANDQDFAKMKIDSLGEEWGLK